MGEFERYAVLVLPGVVLDRGSSTGVVCDCSELNERGGGVNAHPDTLQPFITIDGEENSFTLVAVTEVASCDDTSDETVSGGQLATAPEFRFFCHSLCADDWSLGDIFLDHDELSWSALCSFESFEVWMGEGPRTSSHASDTPYNKVKMKYTLMLQHHGR